MTRWAELTATGPLTRPARPADPASPRECPAFGRGRQRAPQAPDGASAADDLPHWAVRQQWHYVDGRWLELYGTGALALALRRSRGTVLRWELKGVLPPAQYARPTAAWGGKRRLYTREQIEALVTAVEEHGLLRRRPQCLTATTLAEALRQAMAEGTACAANRRPG